MLGTYVDSLCALLRFVRLQPTAKTQAYSHYVNYMGPYGYAQFLGKKII